MDNNKYTEFEEIDIDLEELETIEKLLNSTSYNFPVAHLGETTIYFNVKAERIIPDYIKWAVSTEYVIGLPTDKDDPTGYCTNKRACLKKETSGVTTSFPVRLRKEKKIKSGTYKVYKYKNGFAFKRYEQIED